MARKAVQSVRIRRRDLPGGGTEEVVEYKLHPKLPALVQLFEHLGLSAKDNQLEALLGMLPPALQQQVTTILRESLGVKAAPRVLEDPLLTVLGGNIVQPLTG
ncbi:hypothetical protein PX52LOC_02387 [Limnoglobus roseus]|uniref:Uncharacterized protein n=1 Tax=Limnoglobus roseus TaxID=2598579 RepID=A0A5C1ABR5_9BACT|nr:hypothetical protein PX52LOC_02387 [Limnoglobus roseus]